MPVSTISTIDDVLWTVRNEVRIEMVAKNRLPCRNGLADRYGLSTPVVLSLVYTVRNSCIQIFELNGPECS